MKNLIIFLISIFFLSACNTNTQDSSNDGNEVAGNIAKEEIVDNTPKSLEGKHCFVEAIPQEPFVSNGDTIQFIDSTILYINIVGEKVTGRYDWLPAERDGAYGSIEGTIKDDIIRALYSYTIEGSDQDEEKVFKLSDDKVYIASGEVEEKELESLIKDIENYEFTTTLPRVDCK